MIKTTDNPLTLENYYRLLDYHYQQYKDEYSVLLLMPKMVHGEPFVGGQRLSTTLSVTGAFRVYPGFERAPRTAR